MTIELTHLVEPDNPGVYSLCGDYLPKRYYYVCNYKDKASFSEDVNCDRCLGILGLKELAEVNLDGPDEPKCMDCGRIANWYIEGQPGSSGWSCGKDDCWKYRK